MNQAALIIHWLDMLGIGVFAASGALLAHRKHLDGFGVLVLASVTAIGGGTLRDIILDVPVFWVYDHSAFYAIGIASAISVLVIRIYGRLPRRALVIADALGLALFVVMGTQKALDQNVSYLIAIIMGTFTAVAGGMLRDILVQDTPMVLKQELYATVCIGGSGLYILLLNIPMPPLDATIISILMTFSIRLAAYQWKWNLPVFNSANPYKAAARTYSRKPELDPGARGQDQAKRQKNK